MYHSLALRATRSATAKASLLGVAATERRKKAGLEDRIARASEEALQARKIVTPIDAFTRIGWLPSTAVERWRQGRIDSLEDAASADLNRLAEALRLLRRWAECRGLRPSESVYTSATRDRRKLRFSKSGDPSIERAFRTHWLSSDLRPDQAERVEGRAARVPELVVISPLREWECGSCTGTGSFLLMEDGTPTCLACADMDHLAFLPSGDAALSRRAKAASGLWAVVVRFSRSRRRYERQGLLVEEAALERAEAECLADSDRRERRRIREEARRTEGDAELASALAKEIARLFPGCPAERAWTIARHTSVRGSGRIGRTTAARTLDPDAVTLAVVASVRHHETQYDELLMSGMARSEARERVAPVVAGTLAAWRQRPPWPS